MGGKNNHRKRKFPLAKDSFRPFHNEKDAGTDSAVTSQANSKVTSGKMSNAVSFVFHVTAKSETVYQGCKDTTIVPKWNSILLMTMSSSPKTNAQLAQVTGNWRLK